MALLHPFSLFYTQKVFLIDRSILFSSLDFYPVTYLSFLTYSTYSFRIEFIPQIYTKRSLSLSLSLRHNYKTTLTFYLSHVSTNTDTIFLSLSLCHSFSHRSFCFQPQRTTFFAHPPFVKCNLKHVSFIFETIILEN